MMDNEKIAKIIKRIREENNLTQEEFGDKYGVTYQAVSKWENGKNIPDISLLSKICNDYDLDINEVLKGKYVLKDDGISIKSIVIIIIVTLLIFGLIIWLIFKSNNFEFKTLSSTCNDFAISGSLAYNRNKSYLYISNIDYCGGDLNTYFEDFECDLLQIDGDKEIVIDSVNYDTKDKLLEEYVRNIRFKVSDKYKINGDSILALEIRANDYDKEPHTYRIPLKFNN